MGVILGPPEIYKPMDAAAAAESSDSESDSFVDAMVTNFNTTSAVEPPPMGLAVNLSLTYRSTTNPCLDFFFQVLPGSDTEKIRNHLRLAWDHDPLTTLKLICNLRGVRGTGKSDKEGYYTAALWLHGLHPKTLACNLRQIAKFGYFKDFPEILYRLLEGHNVREKAKREHELRKGRRKRTRRRRRHSRAQDDDEEEEKKKVPLTEAQRETRILENQRKHMAEKVAAKLARENSKKEKSRKAILRYNHDPDYRYLHDCISDLFSEFLKKDLESLKQGSSGISLAAKWCPSLNSPFDESTLLCESIARKIFPKEEYPEYTGIEDAQYAYRVRDRLRKQVLVPLRSALQLPEVYMGAKNWSSLPYNRVPSLAMKAYEKKFLKHDKERFEGYLEDVKSGKATIAAGARLPHEIIKSVTEDGSKSAVAEAQWRRMVEDLSKKGKLSNCLAICDVSSSSGRGGRGKTEVNLVSMALGLLVSELSEEPWKGKLITFSTTPKLRRIKGESLESKVEFMKKMKTGSMADFQKVFDAILEVAEMAKLREDQMIKRVFVFSGMEFNQAFISLSHYDVYSRQWETDYKAIERKFRAKGYENCIPEMVFWNLRDSSCTPVVAKQKGVALVSGRSKNMLKTFLEDEGLINPVAIMESAISGQEYANLAVFD